MTIKLTNISKKFGANWIFKGVDATIEEQAKWAIVGNNGSGKSTLLKIIAGYSTPTLGELSFGNKEVADWQQHYAYCAPYLDLIEEMTLSEMVNFHQKLKPLSPETSLRDIKDLLQFGDDKFIKEYSSGMKQRLKLVLAFFSDVPVLLLDEPTANLDAQGVQWYQQLVKDYGASKTIIVASNEQREYEFCSDKIDILSFK